MKLLHTADWHLGMTVRRRGTYLEDQRYALEQIGRIAREEQVDGILLAGDVFDRGVAPKDALALYDETMTRFCLEWKIPVYVIAGNHDGAERLSQCNELLKVGGLYVVGALSEEVAVVRGTDCDIYMLPWITTDKVKSVYPEEAEEVQSMEDAYRVVLRHYREAFEEGKKNVLLAHAFIVNADTSVSDRAAEVGQATMVGSYVFDAFDYVALGHLHGPQDIRENLRYAGTPMPYAFGKEEKQEKSVTILDTDTMTRKICPLSLLHQRRTLTGTYEELKEMQLEEEIQEGYVRLEVTDCYVGLEKISFLETRFPNLLEISSLDAEGETGNITMTMEELEDVQEDPDVLFTRFCEDQNKRKPGAHEMELFQKAVREYERRMVEGGDEG